MSVKCRYVNWSGLFKLSFWETDCSRALARMSKARVLLVQQSKDTTGTILDVSGGWVTP